MSRLNNKQRKGNARVALQAVLLADSFMTPHRFRPMTKHTPKVLLPLLNIPMLEYSLEFLATAKVDEIIIFAASHAESIQSYIQSTRWLNKAPELNVKVVVSKESKSMGDALRFLESMDIIKNDFLLMTADVISNIDLGPLIVQHKARCAADPTNASMTMIFTKIQPQHAMRARNDDLCIATNHRTGRLIAYTNNIQDGNFVLDDFTVMENGACGIDVHTDLFDTGIVICTPKVLKQFAENFDYKNVAQDYLMAQMRADSDPEVVVPVDHVYTAVVEKGSYATRVVDMRTYHTATHDIIRKWVSPLVISNNVLGETTYRAYPNNNYREDNVSLAHTTLLKGDCVIGRGTHLGDSTVLHKVVAGRNVIIGTNNSITSSYLLDNVKIGSKCVISGAFIGKNVEIGDNVIVHKGAVIDNNVKIASGTIISPYVSITASPDYDQEELEALSLERQRIDYLQSIKKYVPNDVTNATSLDKYPVDPRTFFYNNETEEELSARIQRINHTPIDTRGFDEEHFNAMDLRYPRILLPSIEVLQRDSSPHPIFDKLTMAQIYHCTNTEEYKNAMLDGGLLNSPQLATPRQHQRGDFATYTSNKQNHHFISTKRHEQLSSAAGQNNNNNTPLSSSTEILMMLSPSTLQQTLNTNSSEVYQALQRPLRYNPLSDLVDLHKLPNDIVVGQGGVGRVYLHPPHGQYGRAILLLNAIVPPAYLNLQNYPLLNKTQVQQLLYGCEEDEDDDEGDDKQYFDMVYNNAPGGAGGANNMNDNSDDNEDDYYSDSEDEQIIMPSSSSATQTITNTMNINDGLSQCRNYINEIIRTCQPAITTSQKAKPEADELSSLKNLLQEIPTMRFVYKSLSYDIVILTGIFTIFHHSNLPPPNRGFFEKEEPLWTLETPTDLRKSVGLLKSNMRLWRDLLSTSKRDMLPIVLPALVAACLFNKQYVPLFQFVLLYAYENDLIESDDLKTFYAKFKGTDTQPPSLQGAEMSLLQHLLPYDDEAKTQISDIKALLPSYQKVLKHVIEQEEEDDDDDEDDEEESD